MNAVMLPTSNRMIRMLSAIAAGLIVVQILLLQQPAYAERVIDATSDKLIHFVVFGAIAFFIWLATGGRWALMVWAVVVLIGAIDETQQIDAPGRTASIADLVADGAGATAALLVLNSMNSRKKED
jgi:VanZ family protein